MTQVVKLFSVPNPLAKCLGRKAGISLDDAVKQAEANVQGGREQSLNEIDGLLEQVRRLAATLDDSAKSAARDEIYRLSESIASLAGVFDLGPLHQAAYGLCELIDRLDVLQRACPSAVAVHVEGLRLLRHIDGTVQQPAARAILDGLAKVLAHVDSPAATSDQAQADRPSRTR